MKKIIHGSLLLLSTSLVFAQKEKEKEGSRKPPPVEERWKHDSEKLSALNLSGQQLAQSKTIFYTFYQNMDALMAKSKEKRPEREAVDKLLHERNDAIKKLLSKDQSEKFSTIERSLMPPPPPHDKKDPPIS